MRQRADELLQKMGDPAAVLVTSIDTDNNVIIVSKVSKVCEEYFSAVDLMRQVCDPLDGRGGGRPKYGSRRCPS